VKKTALACLVLPVVLTTPARAADVAVLKSIETPGWRPAIDALRRAAAAHNVAEYDLKGDQAEALRVIGELKDKPVIVVALGPLAAQTMRSAAPGRALIYGMVQDPAEAGLLGAENAAGVAFAIPIRNQLAAFRMVNPRGVRVGVIYGSDALQKQVDEAAQASLVVRLVIVPRRVSNEKEVPEALRALLKGGDAVDALWLPADPLLLGDATRRFLLAETLKARKPVYTFSPLIVAEGALVSNGPDYASIGEQLAELVARAAGGLQGPRSDLLVPRGELVINQKAAEKLKLEIPATALSAANKVL
jgi:putative ABC transport system substrate-binding protein